MDDGLRIRVEQDARGPILRLNGEIDMGTVEVFEACVSGVEDLTVTLDFCGVTFMDSSAVNAMRLFQQELRARGGRLTLYGLRPGQVRILEVLGLRDFFDSLVPS